MLKIVEKLWKNLLINGWRNCEKVRNVLLGRVHSAGEMCKMEQKKLGFEIFYTEFCRWVDNLLIKSFYTVSTGFITITTNNLIERTVYGN